MISTHPWRIVAAMRQAAAGAAADSMLVIAQSMHSSARHATAMSIGTLT
jgi:hypothetical protein